MNASAFQSIFPLFRKAPDDIIAELVSRGQRVSIAAGIQIYRQGDACNGIAFVLEGEIRVYRIGQTGREITLYEIGPGETCILNASCILSGKTYPAHAIALSDLQLLIVPAAVFSELVRKTETMRQFVFALLSERLAEVMELVEEVAFGRVDERLHDYLVEKSENGGLETTHQNIANDLGTSREVVSRLLKDLERRGKVRLSRNSITLLSL